MQGGGSSSGYSPISSRSRRPSSAFVAGLGARLVRRGNERRVLAPGRRLRQLLVEQIGDDVERWKALIEQFETCRARCRRSFSNA